MPRPRRDPKTLTPAEARRLRDLQCWLMMECIGLSMADVAYIQSLSVKRRHLYHRRKACKIGVQEIVNRMRVVNAERLGRVSAD